MPPRLSPLAAAVLLCAPTLLAPALRAQSPAPTAQQVITRMLTDLHLTLPADTVDTFKAGDPATPVTGIATTFLPTLAVLQQAVAHGDNLILTHEPTFYNHRDETTLFATDPVYLQKLAYIQQHHLVLFRLHDAWHARDPDGIIEGWVAKAGWQKLRNPGELPTFTLPATTLGALAQHLQTIFGVRTIRVVGNPALPVTHVAYIPGASGEQLQVAALERDDVQVLLIGEVPEWETIEYVRDAALEGRPKALILLGHDTSEEAGMNTCATWLRTLFPTLHIDFLPAHEPYWPAGTPPTPGPTEPGR